MGAFYGLRDKDGNQIKSYCRLVKSIEPGFVTPTGHTVLEVDKIGRYVRTWKFLIKCVCRRSRWIGYNGMCYTINGRRKGCMTCAARARRGNSAKTKYRRRIVGRECRFCGRTDSELTFPVNNECVSCQRQKLRRPCPDCGGPFKLKGGCVSRCNDQ